MPNLNSSIKVTYKLKTVSHAVFKISHSLSIVAARQRDRLIKSIFDVMILTYKF